ncbi:hypothetical protein HK101_005008 [Irineochytrium annulatum]|nr:hypothetical protein HK101_005008 [Irineochytrium annulatum]
MKLRLKAELSSSRADLASVTAELATALEDARRVPELERDLIAARDVIERQKAELDMTRKAHASALDHILRNADASYLDVELDLASVRHLLESPWTPLQDGEEAGSLEGFCPPKRIRRAWDEDSEWDSDVELSEGLAWFRMGSGQLRKLVEGQRREREGGAEIEVKVVAASVAAAATNVDAEEFKRILPLIQKKTSRGSLDADEDTAAGSTIVATSGDEAALSLSPTTRSAGEDTTTVGSDLSDNEVTPVSVAIEKQRQAAAMWSSPVTEVMNADAEAALWKGPVRKPSRREMRAQAAAAAAARSPAFVPEDDDASSALWTGPVRSIPTRPRSGSAASLSSASSSTHASAAAADAEALSSISTADLAEAEAVVWSGKVKSKRSSRQHDTAASSVIREGKAARRSKKVSMPEEIDPARSVGEGSETRRSIRENSSRVPMTPLEFQQQQREQLREQRHQQQQQQQQQMRDVPDAANPTRSWFNPLRSLVESIGEQLAPPPPPAALMRQRLAAEESKARAAAAAVAATNVVAGVGAEQESARERSRREMRERDERARAAAAALIDGPISESPKTVVAPQSVGDPVTAPPPRARQMSSSVHLVKPSVGDVPASPSQSQQLKAGSRRGSRSGAIPPPLVTGAPGTGGVPVAANPSSALERMASAFENALESAIENPWSLVPGWLKAREVVREPVREALKEVRIETRAEARDVVEMSVGVEIAGDADKKLK